LFIAEKKCYNFIKNNLRAPPIPLVKKWGTKMGLSPQETASVNDRLLIRHQLGTKKKHYFPPSLLKSIFTGPDSGALNNTKKHQKVTPRSYSSPYLLQGDIGFIHYKKKRYGQFFCAINTYSKYVYAIPIRNLKASTLVDAIGSMLKV